MKKKKIRFDILTIFPQALDSYFDESLIKRAKEKGIVQIVLHNLRDYLSDKKERVDDRPFGGGPGMVLKIEPIYKVIKKIITRSKKKKRVILFSTRGNKLDAKMAKRLAGYDQLILICGRYEGIDERVAEHIADEEVSLGDFVLSGGELPAAVLLEAVSRFIPDFLGKQESLEDIKGSYSTYTRPVSFSPGKGKKSWDVPEVLRSGNHEKIRRFRNDVG